MIWKKLVSFFLKICLRNQNKLVGCLTMHRIILSSNYLSSPVWDNDFLNNIFQFLRFHPVVQKSTIESDFFQYSKFRSRFTQGSIRVIHKKQSFSRLVLCHECMSAYKNIFENPNFVREAWNSFRVVLSLKAGLTHRLNRNWNLEWY